MLVSIGPYAKFSPSRVPQPPYPQVSSGLQAVATGARKVIVPEIYRESYYDKWIAEPRILVVITPDNGLGQIQIQLDFGSWIQLDLDVDGYGHPLGS